jgi:hypothetical protein
LTSSLYILWARNCIYIVCDIVPPQVYRAFFLLLRKLYMKVISTTILLVYFSWLILSWKKRLHIWNFHIRDFHNRDTEIPEDSKRILQNIFSKIERTHQNKNLHNISLRRKYPGEWKNLEDLQLRKSVFPTHHPDAQLPKSGHPS